MNGPGWQGIFRDAIAKVQRVNLERQLEPILVNLNKAIVERNSLTAASCAQSMAQAVGQIADLTGSAAVCDQIVQLMGSISDALISSKLDTRVRAMVRVETWQKDNSAKVILDWEAFKIMVFRGSRTVQS